MPSRPKTPDDFDSPWKDALHFYLRSFLQFFYPDIEAEIDWARPYESLDKEFQQVRRRARTGKRLADKLFKVWLRNGEELWLLIHVEVQGDYERDFPQRMFDYYAAIRQLYNRHIVSLAVLCDDRPEWRPTSFTEERWGCKVEFTFRTAKLLDHRQREQSLEQNGNPFAMIVLAHLKALESRRDPELRQTWKLQIVKALYRRNWNKDDVRRLFRLIDWIMTLPEDLDEAFRTQIYDFEKEQQVEYLSSIERHGYKKGLKQGMKTGLKEGLKEGQLTGMRKGVLEGIALMLEAKFGSAGRKLLPRVRELTDLAELRRFARFLKSAKTIEEVRERLGGGQ